MTLGVMEDIVRRKDVGMIEKARSFEALAKLAPMSGREPRKLVGVKGKTEDGLLCREFDPPKHGACPTFTCDALDPIRADIFGQAQGVPRCDELWVGSVCTSMRRGALSLCSKERL